jgi:hypothetical protein
MPDDSLKPNHPDIPRGTLSADRMQTILRRLDSGFYSSPVALGIIAHRVLADLNPSAPGGPPGR